MGYYFLRPSTEKGKSARIYGHDPGFILLDNTQGDLSYHEFPDFEPKFSGIHLEKGSVIVDFIYDGGGFGGHGFVLSEKAMDIIKDFNLPPHRFYALPAYVHKDRAYSYYYMQILVADDNYDYIDFENSVFQIDFGEPEPEGRSEEFRFADSDAMEEAFQKYWMPDEQLYAREIALSDEFYQKAPDLFYVSHIFDTCVISERLKHSLEANGISGIDDFYQNMPGIAGNPIKIADKGRAEERIEKEPFEPKDLDDVTRKLDFIFGQMDQDEDAVYESDQEIEASLAFLSGTQDPIAPLFRYIEQFPDASHGAPGPFLHYLESYYGKGLESELTASIKRNPTAQTIQLVYGIANDAANPERQKFKAILEEIAANSTDEYMAQTAQDCLDDL